MVSLFQFMRSLLKANKKRRVYICVIYIILDLYLYLFYLKHLELLYVLYT